MEHSYGILRNECVLRFDVNDSKEVVVVIESGNTFQENSCCQSPPKQCAYRKLLFLLFVNFLFMQMYDSCEGANSCKSANSCEGAKSCESANSIN